MDEWATQLLLNFGTLCPSSYLMCRQDFILYCNTAKVINSVLCILPELNKLHFPSLQKKDADTLWHEKLFVRSMTTFPPLELDMQNKLQN